LRQSLGLGKHPIDSVQHSKKSEKLLDFAAQAALIQRFSNESDYQNPRPSIHRY
jgi:hypothetical protein